MNAKQVLLCQQITNAGKIMHDHGFVVSNSGNISARSSEHDILITPSGVSKGLLQPDMILRVDFSGKVLEGSRVPSVETPMHLAIYEADPTIKAVVHAHPYHATLCAILGIALDLPVLAEAVIGVGMIPIAQFELPGTAALANSVVPFVGRYQGCLLANHGAITWAASVEKAFYQMEQIEFYAKIILGLLAQKRAE